MCAFAMWQCCSDETISCNSFMQPRHTITQHKVILCGCIILCSNNISALTKPSILPYVFSESSCLVIFWFISFTTFSNYSGQWWSRWWWGWLFAFEGCWSYCCILSGLSLHDETFCINFAIWRHHCEDIIPFVFRSNLYFAFYHAAVADGTNNSLLCSCELAVSSLASFLALLQYSLFSLIWSQGPCGFIPSWWVWWIIFLWQARSE